MPRQTVKVILCLISLSLAGTPTFAKGKNQVQLNADNYATIVDSSIPGSSKSKGGKPCSIQMNGTTVCCLLELEFETSPFLKELPAGVPNQTWRLNDCRGACNPIGLSRYSS